MISGDHDSANLVASRIETHSRLHRNTSTLHRQHDTITGHGTARLFSSFTHYPTLLLRDPDNVLAGILCLSVSREDEGLFGMLRG